LNIRAGKFARSGGCRGCPGGYFWTAGGLQERGAPEALQTKRGPSICRGRGAHTTYHIRGMWAKSPRSFGPPPPAAAPRGELRFSCMFGMSCMCASKRCVARQKTRRRPREPVCVPVCPPRRPVCGGPPWGEAPRAGAPKHQRAPRNRSGRGPLRYPGGWPRDLKSLAPRPQTLRHGHVLTPYQIGIASYKLLPAPWVA
jgi:hypothetical protein